MEFDIKKNSAAEVSEKCTEDNTAIKLGSGKSPVYATPALVALMENAAINACDPQLPEGYNTVGIVGEATHERFIIESAPFLAKAEAKKAAAK